MSDTAKQTSDKHRAAIQSWFDAVIHDGGIDRFDDLHIDQIDDAWKSPSTWISAALESFETALKVRDANKDGQNLKIALAFALESEARPLGITFKDREGLESSFCATPPSLYVLRTGSEFWDSLNPSDTESMDQGPVVRYLNTTELFGEMRRPVTCVFLESKRFEEDEYSRSLFICE